MTRWLVTGAGGMLGHDLISVLAARPDDAVTAVTRASLDVTDADAVDAVLAGHDVVLNAAAWTDVDGAEAHEAEALAVNGIAPGLLARACTRHGARLVHVSTDYVFDGSATEPYAEDAPTGPRSAYGRTKLAGEQAVLASDAHAYVVRTAWVYGEHGKSFVSTMRSLASRDGPVDVVDDQRGSPTWSRDLAEALVSLARSGAPSGVYHATNAGTATWYDLARAVFAGVGADPARVHPTTTAAYPRPAPRPAYSVLGQARWATSGLPPLRSWDEALAAYLADSRDRSGR